MTNKTLLTDEEAMQLVVEGDLDKMTVLFEKYHKHVFNFYLKKGHSKISSEDLVQDVFIRIMKYRSTYDSSLPFSAWFFRIARNVEADSIRKQKFAIDQNVKIESLNLVSDNILDEIEKKEMHSKLDRAISMLSDTEQELLHFSKFQKMQYAEIAEIVHMSESAVKVRVHRAIKKLKTHYQKIDAL